MFARPLQSPSDMTPPVPGTPRVPAYKSPYGPNWRGTGISSMALTEFRYYFQTHVGTITPKTVMRTSVKAGLFGGVALFTVIFYASGIPRIQQDILQRIPIIGQRFIKEKIPASDNPF
ncbi:hypothetical protein N657DRAFT_632048 [Parathielavia appendiculata]|uniref:Cytochrome b-c1 complex subunit 10 n=1 Tax=Parathielavia appendiculata TaxID=2587402 RepID=A0AAN6U3Q2_9PEZI|nr:hypothetical protein N657DRAFT_632048 [Parathielavia appendiculata]